MITLAVESGFTNELQNFYPVQLTHFQIQQRDIQYQIVSVRLDLPIRPNTVNVNDEPLTNRHFFR